MRQQECKKPIVALCIVACAVTLVGCAKKTNHGKVSGDVTLDGQPLKSGVIHFESADGKAATADATIADGKYSVEMAPGDKRISISAPKVIGRRKAYDNLPDSPTLDTIEELLPAKYNAQSELKLTVASGSQQQNYDLKSSK